MSGERWIPVPFPLPSIPMTNLFLLLSRGCVVSRPFRWPLGQSQHPLQGFTVRGTRAFLPPKPGGWSSASNGTTPRSMAVGSTWRSPNLASSPHSVSIAASPTNKSSARKSPHGSTTAMLNTPRPTGTSQPRTHASNSSTCTLHSE